jgi:hypothetical protein
MREHVAHQWRRQGLGQGHRFRQRRVLVPQQRAPIMVTVEYGGMEKLKMAGRERDLNRLNMKVEDVDWALYLDGDLKLVRIVVPTEQTEVVRE